MKAVVRRGTAKPRTRKAPRKTHTQEETQASVSPPGNVLGKEPGSARSVTMAYSATKRRTPPTKPIVQKSQLQDSGGEGGG